MKTIKRILLVLLIINISFVLFAANVEAVGYGNTIAMAKTSAMNNLSSSVFGAFTFSDTSITTTDDGTNASFDYNQDLTNFTYGKLECVKFTDPEESNQFELSSGKYKITAYLDEEATRFYQNVLEQSIVNIKYFNKTRDQDLENDKNRLLNLLNAMMMYDNSKQVLLRLGVSNADIKSHDEQITVQSIYYEYEYALINEVNKISGEINVVKTESVRKELEIMLKENEQARKDLEVTKEVARMQSQMINSAIINERIQSTLEKSLSPTIVNENNSLDGYINEIKALVDDYNLIVSESNELLAESLSRINTEYSENEYLTKNKPYRTAELAANGKPTQFAINKRNEEVDALKKLWDAEIASVEKVLKDSFVNQILEKKATILNIVKESYDSDYTLNLNTGELSTIIPLYDGDNFSWSANIHHDTGFVAEVDLPYHIISGTEANIQDKYYEYLDEQEQYDRLLRNDFSSLFNIRLNVSAVVDIEKGQYYFSLNGITLISETDSFSIDTKTGKYKKWLLLTEPTKKSALLSDVDNQITDEDYVTHYSILIDQVNYDIKYQSTIATPSEKRPVLPVKVVEMPKLIIVEEEPVFEEPIVEDTFEEKVESEAVVEVIEEPVKKSIKRFDFNIHANASLDLPEEGKALVLTEIKPSFRIGLDVNYNIFSFLYAGLTPYFYLGEAYKETLDAGLAANLGFHFINEEGGWLKETAIGARASLLSTSVVFNGYFQVFGGPFGFEFGVDLDEEFEFKKIYAGIGIFL